MATRGGAGEAAIEAVLAPCVPEVRDLSERLRALVRAAAPTAREQPARDGVERRKQQR